MDRDKIKLKGTVEKISLISTIITLIIMGIVILFDISYPDPKFSILLTCSFVFLAISLVGIVISTIINMKYSLKERNYIGFLFILFGALVWIYEFILKDWISR